MAFPKIDVIQGITSKMLNGIFETFICEEFDCVAYQKQGGPCIIVIPTHPDRKPFECPYNCAPRNQRCEISVEPLTLCPDDYDND